MFGACRVGALPLQGLSWSISYLLVLSEVFQTLETLNPESQTARHAKSVELYLLACLVCFASPYHAETPQTEERRIDKPRNPTIPTCSLDNIASTPAP